MAFSILRQSLCTPRFLLAMLGTALLLLVSSIEGLVGAFRAAGLIAFGTHTEIMLCAMGGAGMALALPILSALPYTTAYIDDVKSGYYKAYLPRAGINRYVAGKAIACALSGGLAILLGVLLAYGAVSLALLPMEAAPMIVTGGAETAKGLSPVYGRCALLFASGCFWSLLGLLLSSLTGSRHLAYAGPFVICYLLIILYERYFDFLYVLYPREWLNPSGQWVLGAWGAAILLLVFSGAVGSIFAYWAKGRLVRE